MNLQGQNVVVIGTGRSGMAATELLTSRGAHVRAMASQTPSTEDQAVLSRLGVSFIPQQSQDLANAELIVISPGVPFDLPMLVDARHRGVDVIGEVELASYFLKGPILGITGSNGKTTTTALADHLLQHAKMPVQVGGNIGTAVTLLVDSSADSQWNVLELSSFQLESIAHFRARVAVCLNVTPDHLDRHHTFEAYADAKARLFETQHPGDFAVLNYDDLTCRAFAQKTKSEVFWFSATQRVPTGVWRENDDIYFNQHLFLNRSQIHLRGSHNVENVMAAAAAVHLAGAPLAAIAPGVATFRAVEHRLEFVRNLDGVDYFNDSKATNVDATLKAIEAFPGNLWIILGGKDKGSDYVPLRAPLAAKAKGVLLIGAEPPYPYAAAPIIRTALQDCVPMFDVGTMAEAVSHAHSHASAGDTVLLAPACASFDQFQNFEERGRVFKHLVHNLFSLSYPESDTKTT